LKGELGTGAFGTVWAARHRLLKRDEAIKVLTVPRGVAPADFVREASLLAQMDHPHIVRVFDCKEGDGLCLIIMELLAGGKLRDRMSAISPEGACAVGIAIAEALGHAYRKTRALHRDIKPDNVVFDAYRQPKVTDFGVAKILEGSEAAVNSGMGTIAYMSPEQFDGRPLDPSSDVYAVGVVLFEMLTGQLPFDPALAPNERYRRQLTSVPRPAGVPPALAAVIMRALNPDPAMRALNPDPQRRAAAADEFALELGAAADRSYGPDWRARSGITLRTGEGAHATAAAPDGRPSAGWPGSDAIDPPRIRTEATPDPAAVPTRSAGAPRQSVPGTDERPPPRRDRRMIVIVAAAIAVVVGLVTFAIYNIGSSKGPSNALPAGNPKPGTHTTASAAAHQAAGVPIPFSPTGFIPDAVAFSPGGTMIAVAATAPGGGNGNTYLWSPATGSVRILHDPGSQGAQSVAFSPDGATLAVGDANGGIYLWKLASAAYTTLRDPGSMGVRAVAFGPAGVLAAGDANGSTYLWNWATGARTGAALHDPGSMGVQAVAFSPDGTALAAGDADGSIYLWDWIAGTRTRTLTDPSAPNVVSLSPDVEALAFDPKGTVLAVGDGNGSTYLWNWVTAARIRTLTDPSGEGVQAVAFSPDGIVLAAGDADGSSYLWNWAADRVTRTLHAAQETHGVSSVAFGRDGTEFAAADHAGSTFLWHL
jgi:eukaryotic-like serine/threonine-protein kinase